MITIYEKVQKKFMPILWFEQHVKMSEEIADEVKMILQLPRLGQIMGFVFIVIGALQIAFFPLKNCLTRLFCTKHIKNCDLNKNLKVDPIELKHMPEISPLIQEKTAEMILLGNVNKNGLRCKEALMQ